MKIKLASLADKIAANYQARNADITDDNIWEEILEDVRHEEPHMDYFALDMVVGMVASRLGIIKARHVKMMLAPNEEDEG